MTNATDPVGLAPERVFVTDRELLIQLAFRIVDSRAVAEELVQESWIRWHGKDYSAQHARPIFRRIVTNLAKDWRRSRNVENAALSEVQAMYQSAPCTETAFIAKSELLMVIRAMQRMPARNVKAFRLRSLEGKTYKQIGASLGVSISHARNLVEDVLVELILSLDR